MAPRATHPVTRDRGPATGSIESPQRGVHPLARLREGRAKVHRSLRGRIEAIREADRTPISSWIAGSAEVAEIADRSGRPTAADARPQRTPGRSGRPRSR